MTRIALVRHPRPDIAAGICYGRLDIGLHPDAADQIATIAAHLQGFDTIWSSPARRCRTLAETLHPTPRFDDRLLELNFGTWEGLAWDDIPRAEIDAWAEKIETFAPPGGESGAQLIERVRHFHDTHLTGTRRTIVISHGGPLRILRALLERRPINLLDPPMKIAEIQLFS